MFDLDGCCLNYCWDIRLFTHSVSSVGRGCMEMIQKSLSLIFISLSLLVVSFQMNQRLKVFLEFIFNQIMSESFRRQISNFHFPPLSITFQRFPATLNLLKAIQTTRKTISSWLISTKFASPRRRRQNICLSAKRKTTTLRMKNLRKFGQKQFFQQKLLMEKPKPQQKHFKEEFKTASAGEGTAIHLL